MKAGFQLQHFVCSKYRVVGFGDVTLAEYCTKRSAFAFIKKHPSAPFYRKRIFIDLYMNGNLYSSDLYYTEP